MADQPPFIHFQSNVTWQNKHQNVTRQVARLYDAWNLWADGSRPETDAWRAGLSALRQIIQGAKALNRRVRPLGGGWSLSEAAATNDFLVNTKPLNFIKIGLQPIHCVPAMQQSAGQLVFAQCGASILELNQTLEAANLSLKTSGASNGQTIAGALSTGTHGAANQIGAMQECILGLHVLADDGAAYWIERASSPVVTDAFCDFLGARPLRDDNLFRAAVVSFGTFGLIHAVLLEVEPIFLLERYIRRFEYDDVLAAISSLDVGSLGLPQGRTLPFHFEVVINPYGTSKGKQGAYVRAMYKRPFKAIPSQPSPVVVTGPGDDVLGFAGALGEIAPFAIPSAVGHLLDAEMKPVEGSLGTHGQTFGTTTLRGPVMCMELGVPLKTVGAAVDAIVEVAGKKPFSGVIALRYVKASDALLGFTRFKDTTCTIELPSSLSSRTADAFDNVCEALHTGGLPYTLHWGQCLPLPYTVERVRETFGDDVDRWLTARRGFLTSPAARRMFANVVAERCGLAD